MLETEPAEHKIRIYESLCFFIKGIDGIQQHFIGRKLLCSLLSRSAVFLEHFLDMITPVKAVVYKVDIKIDVHMGSAPGTVFAGSIVLAGGFFQLFCSESEGYEAGSGSG